MATIISARLGSPAIVAIVRNVLGIQDADTQGLGAHRSDPHARLVIMLMLQLLPNTTDVREKFQTMVCQALLDSPRLE